MIRRPPRSTLFPTRRSSDLLSERKPELIDAGHANRNARPGQALPNQESASASSERQPMAACQTSADRKSTRLNSSHMSISYAVFCLKKKKHTQQPRYIKYTH